jgi:2-polyprenyl-3-methyl-5-hydroxy-6-metoxy-1,4-benzoquinol methylase
MNSTKLTSKSFWDEQYKDIEFKEIPKGDTIRSLIEKYIPIASKDQNCIELGCYPGRYLAIFGSLKYTLNGVDTAEGIDTKLPEWLSKVGYKTGKFVKNDVFDFKSSLKYDVVCPFGLIEHFKNWKELIKIKADMVKSKGYIIIETPNFRGFIQRFLHILFDKKNYDIHYIPSMNVDLWKKQLEEEGFTILYSGYFGNFDFWADSQERNIFQRGGISLIRKLLPLLKKLPSNQLYSPYCGLIAKKN